MDFNVGFSKTQVGYASILIIVDLLTKIAYFIPIITIVTTSNVFELFIKNVLKIHRLPLEIISNRDQKF